MNLKIWPPRTLFYFTVSLVVCLFLSVSFGHLLVHSVIAMISTFLSTLFGGLISMLAIVVALTSSEELKLAPPKLASALDVFMTRVKRDVAIVFFSNVVTVVTGISHELLIKSSNVIGLVSAGNLSRFLAFAVIFGLILSTSAVWDIIQSLFILHDARQTIYRDTLR